MITTRISDNIIDSMQVDVSTQKKKQGHPPPVTRDAILAALKQHGPMTSEEIAIAIGRENVSLCATLNRMREGKYIYRKDWRRHSGSRGGSAAPIYARMPRGKHYEDAPRPGPKPRDDKQLSTSAIHRLKTAKHRTGRLPAGALDMMKRELVRGTRT